VRKFSPWFLCGCVIVYVIAFVVLFVVSQEFIEGMAAAVGLILVIIFFPNIPLAWVSAIGLILKLEIVVAALSVPIVFLQVRLQRGR
jgi:hypothetical protein